MSSVGPVGRLGRWTATHFRMVVAIWLMIALTFGLFAPKVEKALSGAGWEATGSESVRARTLIDQNFGGLSSYALMVVVHSRDQTITNPPFRAAVARAQSLLRSNDAIKSVVPPRPGVSISGDGHTAVIRAGAAKSSNDMVRAADELKGPLSKLASGSV